MTAPLVRLICDTHKGSRQPTPQGNQTKAVSVSTRPVSTSGPKWVKRSGRRRSEEHTSELQHQIISYAVFCLKKKKVLYQEQVIQVAMENTGCTASEADKLRRNQNQRDSAEHGREDWDEVLSTGMET